MMGAQTAMIAKITNIFGVDVRKKQIETIILSMLGVYGAMIAGKSLAGGIAKLVPGIGTIGGGLISGSVGMVITGALGRTYIELMTLVVTKKVDLSAITPNELTDLLVSLMPKFLPNFPKQLKMK